MLRRTSNVIGTAIKAKDGSIGSIHNLLFEDDTWRIRWVVIDTGSWLSGRSVLLPPSQLTESRAPLVAYAVDLTKRQVEESPSIDTDKPVSRQMEGSLYGYYGWAPYWGPAVPYGGYVVPLGPGAAMTPPTAVHAPREVAGAKPQNDQRAGDPHLRSVNEVTGYYIEASDGSIGHVEDFIVDQDSWDVRYMMVDTKNWWPGKKVLVSPRWIESVSWHEREVTVSPSRQAVKDSPEFDPVRHLDRDYEHRLHTHYGFPPYWA